MIRRLYSIRDDLSGFSAVIADDNDDLACRGFSSTVHKMLSVDSGSAPYVDDMSIWFIGTFDSDTGMLSPATPEVLMRGKVVRYNYERDKSILAEKKEDLVDEDL